MSNFTKLTRGDFITYTNKPGTFGIYEGVPLHKNNEYFKQYTLVLFFDPSKYQETKNGYKEAPSLEIASETTKCTKTTDTDWENYWWTKLTPKQKIEAEEKLKEFGYKWDEETLTLVSTDTGEIIYQSKDNKPPKPKYDGRVIKLITKEIEKKLRDSIKVTTTKSNYYHYEEEYPRGYWNGNMEDWYD